MGGQPKTPRGGGPKTRQPERSQDQELFSLELALLDTLAAPFPSVDPLPIAPGYSSQSNLGPVSFPYPRLSLPTPAIAKSEVTLAAASCPGLVGSWKHEPPAELPLGAFVPRC